MRRLLPGPSVCVATGLIACLGVSLFAASVEIASDAMLTINSVNAVGGGLAAANDSTTYSVVNASGTKALLGRLNVDMPSHTSLGLSLAAPTGAVSTGLVQLSSSDQSLVTGIGIVNESGLEMTFTLSASVEASLVNSGTRTLTLTLVDEP